MRVLIGDGRGAAGAPDLEQVYAAGRLPWLRVNMVTTVDGSAAGADGRSGSINSAADHRVFETLRGLADAVLVGAGTARAEGYEPGETPIVLVTRGGQVPEPLRDAEPGQVLMLTSETTAGLVEARDLLGAEHVVTAGRDRVDLAAGLAALHGRGLRHLLGEGGPSLLGTLLAAGLVDELDVTTTPVVVGGDQPRIVAGVPALGDGVGLRLATLLEEDGTLLARWLLDR